MPGIIENEIRKPQVVGETTKHAILFVDDEPGVLKALRRSFIDEPYTVLTAPAADAGLEVLSANAISIVISDQQMPNMSGIEFLRRVREKYPHIIRIMLTGQSDHSVAMAAVKDGAVYKFINKPWNDDELKLAVKLALEQHDLIQENIKLKKIAQNQQNELGKLKKYSKADQSPLAQILINNNLLSAGQIDMLENYRRQSNCILAKAILLNGMMKEGDLLKIIQNESRTEFVTIDISSLDEHLANLLPREICEAACLVPIGLKDGILELAMADPLDLSRVEYIRFTCKLNVNPVISRIDDIERAIKYLYDKSVGEYSTDNIAIDFVERQDDIDVILEEQEFETLEQLMAKSATPPAIRMVNMIFFEAIRQKASDIHIEPKITHTFVKYRVDGLLHGHLKIPAALHLPVVSRIKILAKMDIAERRLPQDGRISIKTGDRYMDVRVSSIPTISGEKIVCRLLDKHAAIRSIDHIGITDDQLTRIRKIIKAPQGMIISTGPTGSGKTSTLYSFIQEKMSPELNFLTIEDPVEYYLEQGSQIHVHHKIGLDFASALRAALRQDPDVILVGEIRDNETAKVAMQSAMTGHLVFSTLHTNDTISSFTRLNQMGIEPYLMGGAILAIMAQRLVRTICPYCKVLADYDKDLLPILGLSQDDLPEQLYRGQGCDYCGNTGYAGRIGIFEIFTMNDDFRNLLCSQHTEHDLVAKARESGMWSLAEDGFTKVKQGLTTLPELLRIIGPASKPWRMPDLR